MINVLYILGILSAYTLGSVLLAVVIGNIKHINIKNAGTTNPGAANLGGRLGVKYGFLAGLLDCLKSFVPLLILNHYFSLPSWFLICFSISFIIGHNWSVFYKFSGGKGIATSAGVIFALFPLGYLIIFPIFILISLFRKESLLGNFILFLFSPILTYFIYHNETFTILSVIIFLIFIIRRITYRNNYSLKSIFNKIIFDTE